MKSFTEGFSMLMVIFKLLFVASRVQSVSDACESLQYAEYGQKGIIDCNFMSGFTGVYWYLHVETGFQIIVRLEKQDDGSLARSGAGYIEKKFDILSNGSLILTNVSDFNNQSFKVVHVDEDLRVEEIYVELVTSILPDPKFPLISACNGSNLCFVEDLQSHILTCSFHHSKPAVNLTWYKLSSEKSETLQGKTIISEDGKWTFSSVLKTNISSYINGQLTAFSCRASGPALKSHFTESIVIVDSTNKPWPSLEENVVEEKYIIVNSEAKVHCTDTTRPQNILVWEDFHRHPSHVLGFAANGVTRTVSDHSISHDGSLTFARVKLEDEGLYWCKISDGIKYESNLKQVKVFVPPNPPEIIVAECPSYENECELLIHDAPLRISCYLNGVYPNVTINMESTFGTELRVINQTTYRIGRGNLFNATVTKEISPMDCSTALVIGCKISNPIFLDFIPEKLILLRSEECKGTKFPVAAVVIPFVVVTTVILGFIIFRRKVFQHKGEEEGGHEKSISGKKGTLEDSVPVKDESETPCVEEVGETMASEKESMLKESISVKDETEAPGTEEVEEAMAPEKESMLKESVSVKDETEAPGTEEESEKESMLKESVSVTDETETPSVEDVEEAMNSEKDVVPKESMLARDIAEVCHTKERVEEMVEDRTPSLLQMLEETLHLLMSYPLNNATENHVFNQEAIKIVRDNPVNIKLTKDRGTFTQIAGGALSVTGVALSLFTFGFGAVLAIAGAAVGLAGVAIGFSSKELFEDHSKWSKVKPVFISLIELVKSIAQAIALASNAHELVEYIRHNKVIVHEHTLKEAQFKIKTLTVKHKNFQSLNKNDFIKSFSLIAEDMEQLLRIMKTTYTFPLWSVDEKITLALENPFTKLDSDVLTCIENYDSVKEPSAFINFIKTFFVGYQTGEIPKTTSLEEDLKKTRCSESTKKIVIGSAAAGIVLRAAKVQIDVKFLGADLEKLLGQKEEYTVELTDTANLIENINTAFGKLSK